MMNGHGAKFLLGLIFFGTLYSNTECRAGTTTDLLKLSLPPLVESLILTQITDRETVLDNIQAYRQKTIQLAGLTLATLKELKTKKRQKHISIYQQKLASRLSEAKRLTQEQTPFLPESLRSILFFQLQECENQIKSGQWSALKETTEQVLDVLRAVEVEVRT